MSKINIFKNINTFNVASLSDLVRYPSSSRIMFFFCVVKRSAAFWFTSSQFSGGRRGGVHTGLQAFLCVHDSEPDV